MSAVTEATPNGIKKFSLSHYRCETSPVAVWFHGRGLRYGSEDRDASQVYKPLRHQFDSDRKDPAAHKRYPGAIATVLRYPHRSEDLRGEDHLTDVAPSSNPRV